MKRKLQTEVAVDRTVSVQGSALRESVGGEETLEVAP